MPQGDALSRENIVEDTRKLIWVLAGNITPESRMSRQQFYEVEKLLNKRKLSNSRVEYLVRWRGYSKKHDTWEPLSNLNTCKDLIHEFNEAHGQRATSKAKASPKSNVPSPLVIKEKRVIKPVKIYSPEHIIKPKVSTKTSIHTDSMKSPIGRRLAEKSPVQEKNEQKSDAAQREPRPLRSLRHRKRRSASPVLRSPRVKRTLLRPPPSPMSRKALDHFLASRARNFNHMNKIHTKPPSTDHEYIPLAFTFPLRRNRTQAVRSTVVGSAIATVKGTVANQHEVVAKGHPVSVHGLKDLNYKYRMQSRQLHTYKRGKCMEIIISNEAENNTLSPEVLDEIVRMLEDAAISPVNLVLFRSVGDFFCSGISWRLFCQQIDSGKSQNLVAERYAKSLRNYVNCLIDFPKPLIAVVRGPAIGLGCAMLPHFDTVYCSERAFFSLPYADVGHTPEACSSFLFPKILGHCLANDMLLNGKPITAIEAKSAGFVSDVFHHDSLEQNVLPLAKLLMSKSLEALITTKELIRNPERSRLKHINQCEFVAAKEHWRNPETVKSLKRYMEKLDAT